MLSTITSIFGLLETLLFGRAIAETKLPPRPVFILGAQRTGTTHLHNLLARDRNFLFTDTLLCGFPSLALLLGGPRGRRLLSGFLGQTRPMDNVALSFDQPMEDELATNVLSAGTSPYMPIALMRNERDFRPFFTMQDVPAPELQRWTDAFLYVLRKATLADARRRGPAAGRRLVLKSPVHTSRIPLLLKLFPDAQFIYIHRDPIDVWKSSLHMADTAFTFSALQSPTQGEVEEFLLNQFATLSDAYLAARSEIGEGNLVEIAYKDLDRDPMGTLAGVYQRLGWSGFDAARPGLEAYLGTLRGYEKNKFSERVEGEAGQLLRERWASYFKAFGYK